MVVSFINYELRVNFEPRSKTEVSALHYLTDQYFKDRPAGSLGNFPDLPIVEEENLEDPAANPEEGDDPNNPEENKDGEPVVPLADQLKNEKKTIKPEKFKIQDEPMDGEGPELKDTGVEVVSGKVPTPEELLAEEVKAK